VFLVLGCISRFEKVIRFENRKEYLVRLPYMLDSADDERAIVPTIAANLGVTMILAANQSQAASANFDGLITTAIDVCLLGNSRW